jgi:hypothetical protein
VTSSSHCKAINRVKLRVSLWFALATCFPGFPKAKAQVPSASNSEIRRPILLNLALEFADVGDFDALLREWFGPAAERLTVRTASTWSKDAILASDGARDTLNVWVIQVSPSLARLYFVDAFERRYYLRNVPLHAGLDEVGRENLAQIIVTSTVAFAQQRVSTNLKDIEQALAAPRSETRPASILHQPASPTTTRGPEPARWTLRGGGFYGVTFEQADELRHGPGILIGVVRTSMQKRLTLNAKAQYCWPQTINRSDVALSANTFAIRSTLGLDRYLSENGSFGIEWGVGIDDVHVKARQSPQNTVVPHSVTLLRPATSLGVRAALIQNDVQWALLAGATLYLARTHYDVMIGGEAKVEYRPYIIQPQLALEATWR